MNISMWFVGAVELTTLRRTSTPLDSDGEAQVYVGDGTNVCAYVTADDARKIAAAWLGLADKLDAEVAAVTA